MRSLVGKALCIASVLCAAALAALPARGADGSGDLWAVVTAPMAPTLYDGERDDEVLYGMIGEVLTDRDDQGLYGVRMQYGYKTSIEGQHVALVSRDEAEAWRASVTHQVIAPFADVLPDARTESYPPLITLPRGAYLKVGEPDSEDARWLRAELFGGRTGWVNKNLVRELRAWGQEEAVRAALTADAELYLGVGYRWGGKTPYGLDCSGFTSMVYMLNGLDIYRNSRPEAGYPIALMHVEGTPEDAHTAETLAAAKPGDLVFWGGHVGFYVGNGKYIHSNGSSFNTRVNSLISGDEDFRADLAKPSAIYTWGTAFPAEPNRLVVRRFYALPFTSGDQTGYRFYARADGYAPNRAILYPEGKDGPAIEVGRTRRMLYDNPASEHKDVPVYFYPKPGSYRPTLVLVNDEGYRPEGKTISSDLAEMTEPIAVR